MMEKGERQVSILKNEYFSDIVEWVLLQFGYYLVQLSAIIKDTCTEINHISIRSTIVKRSIDFSG